LDTSLEALPQAAPGSALRRVLVKRDWLRVREAPSYQARILMELPAGSELLVLEEREGWLRIARPTGWVNEDFVRDTGQG
jgi:hypothetical protein